MFAQRNDRNRQQQQQQHRLTLASDCSSLVDCCIRPK